LIWGKLIGGAAGLAFGGPLGALIGAAAGHALDRSVGVDAGDPDPERSVAFTIAVIALSAKMAKADGAVTRDELAAFREVFRFPPEEEANVDRFFDLARRDTAGFEGYARQIAGLFRDAPEVLERLLGGLFHIARADGRVPPAEIAYLRRVAAEFGYDDAAFERLRLAELGTGEDPGEPYAILGVDPRATDAEVKAAWIAQARAHHPDRLTAQGLPRAAIDLATARVARINDAWDRVRRQRGIG
jgi:DnaJ like chaperone protein